jgi:hypothetical protein
VASWDDVRRIALALPEVEEGTSYGEIAFRVRGKSFAHGSPSAQGELVLRVDPDERPLLVEARPDVFHVTPHYEDYGGLVLVRVDAIEVDELRDRLVESWLLRAPKRLAAQLER